MKTIETNIYYSDLSSSALEALASVSEAQREEVVGRAREIAASHGLTSVNGPIMRNAISDVAIEVEARK